MSDIHFSGESHTQDFGNDSFKGENQSADLSGYKAFRLDRILKFVLDVIAIVIASFIIYGICMSILSLIDRGLIEGNLVSEVIDRIFTLLVYIAGIFSAKYIRRG